MKIFYFMSLLLFFNLTFLSSKLKIVDTSKRNGNRWAITVGINDYWDPGITDLKKARNDAINLGDMFTKNGEFTKVFVMSDNLEPRNSNFPTLFNIESNIDYIIKMSDKNDLVIFHFSGHGITNEKNESYLICADTKISSVFTSSISLEFIINKFKSAGLNKILLFVDACRETVSETKGIKKNQFKEKIFQESEVAAVFYATKQGWYSYEDPNSENGIFTRFLLSGLSGKADFNNDKLITFTELDQYVTEEIFNYALTINYQQKPYTKIYGEKFGDIAITKTSGFDTYVESKNSDDEISNENFIVVEGGQFFMGDEKGLGDRNELPTRLVTVNKFIVGKYEVTEKEYNEIMNLESSGNDELPITNITWYEALEFCNKKSEIEGLTQYYNINKEEKDNNNKNSNDPNKWKIELNEQSNGYRLLTEAEWEYIAKESLKPSTSKYSGSDNLSEVAWFEGNSDDMGPKNPGMKKPNKFDIYDLCGNVAEWCFDWFDYYQNLKTAKNPKGADSGASRVVRGGSWISEREECRVSARSYIEPYGKSPYIGFRIARNH